MTTKAPHESGNAHVTGVPLPRSEPVSGLFTDLYELTMTRAYLEQGMTGTAVFSLFVRRLPEQRNFLLACGIDTVVDALERLAFSDDDVAWLAAQPGWSPRLLDWARNYRFRGDVHAVAEGTPVFADEPILEVVGPIADVQFLETLVMNQITVQTVLASKAARIVEAAEGCPVVDFGARRMFGMDAALKAARAFHIAGVSATSNVLAGRHYGLPLRGTMAHSYIQAHDDELEAFRAFTAIYPDTVLLVDTYDTLAGVEKVIALAGMLGEDFRVSAIRLDSGDLRGLAHEARCMLDAAGLHRVGIFASSGLDEWAIARLVADDAPIDGFGVGTHMGVSSDDPALDLVYKLCEYDGRGRLKLSTSKPILPGRKQVFRQEDGQGRAVGDLIAREHESHPGRPLLEPVMQGGGRIRPAADLDDARLTAERAIAGLPAELRELAPATTPYPVRVSDDLLAHQSRIRRNLER